MRREDSLYIKCVVVGDGAVGKTSLLMSYTQNRFPTGYIPTVFDNYAVNVSVADKPCTLALFDTAGQEDYDRLRILCYPGSDVFVLCFSVVNPTSLSNIAEKWALELQQRQPNVPIVLVGTQTDLRPPYINSGSTEKPNNDFVSTKDGWKMAKKIGACDYVECSALTQSGLKGVFDTAILNVMLPPWKHIKTKTWTRVFKSCVKPQCN